MGTVGDESSEFLGDELDWFVVRGVERKFAPLEEPSDSRGVISQREDAILLAFGFVAFYQDEPNCHHHPEELEDVICNVEPLKGA
jgi:hypothetical protein